MRHAIDLTNQKFNKLLVLSRNTRNIAESVMWNCLCDCGQSTVVSGKNLKNGTTKSCGCHRRERLSVEKKTHGQSKTDVYDIWNGMIKRCYNKNTKGYEHYGSRGITVVDNWKNSFETFIKDVGPRPSLNHTLDRKNNNGNYEPNNVRWATKSEQANNRSNNTRFIVNGESKTIAQLARDNNLLPETIMERLKRGHSIDVAITPGNLRDRNKKC